MRIFVKTLVPFFLLSIGVFAQIPNGEFRMKITVDLDSVTMIINSDTAGNPLMRETEFAILKPFGDYRLRFMGKGYEPITREISVHQREIRLIDINFLDNKPVTAAELQDSATLELLSDPDGAKIVIDNSQDSIAAPAKTGVSPGDHTFRAHLSGYEKLEYKMIIDDKQKTSIRFLMAMVQPPPVTAEDLGMYYEPIIPLMDEKQAEEQKETFSNFAETFAIIPLGQGILARLLLGSDNKSANILIVAGAVLSSGSYLLARVLPKRKLKKIKEFNERTTQQNVEAKNRNKEIGDAVAKRNAEIIEEWKKSLPDRGMVEVKIE